MDDPDIIYYRQDRPVRVWFKDVPYFSDCSAWSLQREYYAWLNREVWEMLRAQFRMELHFSMLDGDK